MEDRASHIIEVTVRLLAAEGLSVPTARVAREAGVANGTLFNQFPTKQALLDAVYRRLKGEMAATFGTLDPSATDLAGAMRHAWGAFIRWAVAAPERHRVLHLLKGGGAVSPEAVVEAERQFGEVMGAVEAAMAEGALMSIGFDHFARLAEAEAEVVVALALDRGLAGSDLDALIEQGFGLFLNGVCPRG